MNLYVTADVIGKANHGAGAVTWNESEALRSLGPCEVWGREQLASVSMWNISGEGENEPWMWDNRITYLGNHYSYPQGHPLVHFYAGTFSKTIVGLKDRGSKISYTAAAHSIEESKREHGILGVPYQYPHLTNPELWSRYVQGYLDADLLITPSKHSANVMRSFGADQTRIRIIPHGCRIPATVAEFPSRFVVGYLGNCGAPDKGLRHLFAAWKQLNWHDATLKVAGHDSTSSWVRHLWNTYGSGNVQFCGWQDDLADFYGSLSLYVQPSISEGFGIEVLEAMSHGRAVIASNGCGASDLLAPENVFPSGDAGALAERMDWFRRNVIYNAAGEWHRQQAMNYSWDKVRALYVEAWKSLLGES